MKSEDFRFIIEYAIKAPSGHNTQPWKFENTEEGIVIHPDFSRSLPIVDKENYELYISLGCALENLLIAASHKDYQYTVQYPDNAPSCIKVKLTKSETNETIKRPLLDYIATRQVTKSKYNDRSITAEDLKKLTSCFSVDGVSVLLLDGKERFEKIIPYIIEANSLQFKNKKFISELVNWIRFSKREAEKTRDGIWSATMAMPGLGKFVGSLIMKNFVTAKSEAKRLTDLLEHTRGIAVFITDNNNAITWVKTGQAFQQFGLTATMLGISHAHLNMPCEELAVREEMAKELNIEAKHPLLLIRYGYADKMPYSFRRTIDEVKYPG
ncbi:MAG: nitroreductase [Bacteroidales bacterium]|nr:nitroreductase [Bacteroidales bacterium]